MVRSHEEWKKVKVFSSPGQSECGGGPLKSSRTGVDTITVTTLAKGRVGSHNFSQVAIRNTELQGMASGARSCGKYANANCRMHYF